MVHSTASIFGFVTLVVGKLCWGWFQFLAYISDEFDQSIWDHFIHRWSTCVYYRNWINTYKITRPSLSIRDEYDLSRLTLSLTKPGSHSQVGEIRDENAGVEWS
jgi:hypothetical protein